MPPKVALIPIKKDEDATSYRYKMPRVMPRKVSSGNGVKTAILNSTDIAKAINRTQALLNQWLGYQLACQARINPTSGQIILNGEKSPTQLQNSVYEFIDNFVLCPSCHNPETVMDKRGSTLLLRCHACGQQEPAAQGSRPSYVTKTLEWILAHIQTEQKQGSVTQRSKGRLDEIDDYQRQKEKEVEDGGEGIPIDVAELEAIQKKLDNTAQAAKSERPSEAEVTAYLEKFQKDFEGDDADDMDIFNEFDEIAGRDQWNTLTKLNIVVTHTIKGHKEDLLDVFKGRRGFFIRLMQDEAVQKEFLNFIAKYIEAEQPALMTSAPIIFYTLFDNEIIEKPAMLAWKGRVSKRFEKDANKAKIVRDLLAPFFEWLDKDEYEQPPHAEEEEEREEEKPKQEQAKAGENEEEAINIDDI